MRIENIIGKCKNYFNRGIILLSCIFLTFITLTYLLTWWSKDVQIIYILFIILFSFVGSKFLAKIIDVTSKKIQIITKVKSNQESKILKALVPFAISGILSIILVFLYIYITNIKGKIDYFFYSELMEEIHYYAIFIMSILSIISFFIIATFIFKKTKHTLPYSLFYAGRITLLFMFLSILLMLGIFIASFFIFTFINLSGGAPFG